MTERTKTSQQSITTVRRGLGGPGGQSEHIRQTIAVSKKDRVASATVNTLGSSGGKTLGGRGRVVQRRAAGAGVRGVRSSLVGVGSLERVEACQESKGGEDEGLGEKPVGRRKRIALKPQLSA